MRNNLPYVCIRYFDDYIYVQWDDWDNTFPESTQVSYKAYYLEHYLYPNSDLNAMCPPKPSHI